MPQRCRWKERRFGRSGCDMVFLANVRKSPLYHVRTMHASLAGLQPAGEIVGMFLYCTLICQKVPGFRKM